MIVYKNKEFRNLQEQVLENMKDIANLKEGTAVLSEFGIKVVGEVETIADLPTVLEYKSEHEDWAYGDAYAVGTTSPYTLYILTRANDMYEDDYWFDIGVFPVPGPQGEQGPRGETGPQGQTGATGEQGASAGFGTITATAETLSPGSAATATVVASGPDTAKELSFTFGLPQGESAAFTHYVTITASTIVGGQYTGTLTLTQYNTLYDNYDSVVRLRSSSSLANNYYFLKKWYTSDDYIVFLGVWSLNNNDTRYYLLKIDRSNRKWTLDVGLPIKITSYNINSTSATIGQVLTADGSGGASWQDAPAGSDVVTLTTTVGNLSNDDYNKVAGNNCVIIYDDNTTKVYFKKYDETSTTITYATPYSESSSTYVYGVGITKATKYYQIQSAYMPISNSNIKSGSTIADKYLKTNGSGGAVWGDAPSQVQSDWNESSSSSPAYIKNKPTIPTVPVTDVTVNGTSVMDGTTAKVVVDTVDGATDGTNWTSLTINGTTAAIPQGSSGTVTSVGLSAVSGSNLSVSGSPVTSSGSMTVGVASGYSIPSTTDQTMWNGDMKYQRSVGVTIFGADISWDDLLSSGTTVKKGDTYYVQYARTSTPVCKVGNLIVAESDGTGASTTWKVVPTGSISTISLGGTPVGGVGTAIINTGTAYNSVNNPLATMSDLPASVSGTNDGTNWTSLTVDGVTKSIPAGGGSQKYLHKLILRLHSSTENNNVEIPIDYYSNSDTSMSEYSSEGTILTNLNEVLTYYNAIGSTNPTSLTTLPGIYFYDSTKGHYLYYRTGGWGFYIINLTYTTVQQNPNQFTVSQFTSTTAAYALDDTKIIAL